MTELVLESVNLGPVLTADARLGAGLTIVTGDGPTALSTLVGLMAGVERPRFGRVRLDGADPHSDPAVRRRTGSLLAEEPLAPATTVLAAVERLLRAREDARPAPALLEESGLTLSAQRRPSDLGPAERRSLALALALSHPAARLLSLYEPFHAGTALSEDAVRDAIRRHASNGVIVVVAARDAVELRALSGARLEIRGGILGAARPRLGLFRGPVSLRAQTPEPARLVKALAGDEALSGVHWDESTAPGAVVAVGVDLELVSAALSRAAAASGAPIESITPMTMSQPVGHPHPGMPGTPAPPYAPYGSAPPQPPGYGVGAPQRSPHGSASAPDQSVSMPTAFADPTRPSSEAAGGHGGQSGGPVGGGRAP